MNPFYTQYGTPHETLPFNRITLKDIEEAILEGMRQENEAIKAIIENPAPPTFENTIEAMDTTDHLLASATTVMFNLSSAETNDELDQLTQRMAPLLSEHTNKLQCRAI